ncbi:MAG: Lipid disaccharide synthetase [Verrucomicrobiota bacterium]|jgi:lipid-A-disaccharide synthase
MLIAGEASGDTLAAELVAALRTELLARQQGDSPDVQPLRTALGPRFFGAGGSRMAEAGVELAFDMTKHSVIGISEALKKFFEFRSMLQQLVKLALKRQPDVIVCVDFHGFNGRFAAAVRKAVRAQRGTFNNWRPKIVQFVSPQVWASRPGRADAMAENLDLLLSIFPFEKDWYAQRAPKLRVEFVGHPMIGRFANAERGTRSAEQGTTPRVLLLPGSRRDEVRRHLQLIAETAQRIQQAKPVEFIAIAPNENMAADVRAALSSLGASCRVQVGGIADALRTADLAISKTGTVLMECALFGVPAVAFYKTSWPTYVIGKQVVKVKWLSMPNILADEALFPEFVQDAATPENLSAAALILLNDTARRAAVRARLQKIVASLGEPGAARRAARLVSQLV